MIEAMACGTPVIGWRNGSVPEVIDDGVTGYVVSSIRQAVQALKRVGWLDRSACRKAFEERFDAVRMAHDYVDVYRRLVHASPDLLKFIPCDARGQISQMEGKRVARGRVANAHSPLLGALPRTRTLPVARH